MKFTRYIEVYDNNTDELLESYQVNLPDILVVHIISPDDDYLALCPYVLEIEQVLSLGGNKLVEKYKNMNIEYHVTTYQNLE